MGEAVGFCLGNKACERRQLSFQVVRIYLFIDCHRHMQA
jgi:hypothetical protein